MSRILVLGGSGEIGSIAVADLISHTNHEVTIGDIEPDRARTLLRNLGAPERVLYVDVDDATSLHSALRESDIVLNATYMRHNLFVTDAAIAAGVHMIDLGSYYITTLEQLERHEAAEDAGCRIVPGCGVAPGVTNILARLGADTLDQVVRIRIYSYVTHSLWTSPGHVVTRFDVSSGISVAHENRRTIERPTFSGTEDVVFRDPYGKQQVHLVPHPEPVTLPRYIDVPNVVFKVAYTEDEMARLRVLHQLGFDREEEFELDGQLISPRRFTAAYVGSRGIAVGERTVSAKQVWVEGLRAEEPVSLLYELAAEEVGRSAGSAITGTAAGIAADLVAQGGRAGVYPPEGAFEPRLFLDRLADRGVKVSEHVSGSPAP